MLKKLNFNPFKQITVTGSPLMLSSFHPFSWTGKFEGTEYKHFKYTKFAMKRPNMASMRKIGQGVLVLGTTPGSGFHRHLLEGWPGSQTLWDFLILQVSYSGSGSWVTVRTRHGDTIEGVLSAPWSAVHGPYPPDSFPLDLGVQAKFLEIEVTLSSAVSGDTPLLEAINVVAYEQ